MHGLTHSDLFRQQALSQWRLAKERSALLWRWHELIGKQIPVHGGMSLDMAGNRHTTAISGLKGEIGSAGAARGALRARQSGCYLIVLIG